MNQAFLPKLLKKKYIIIIVFFCLWMIFLDTNSILTHLQLNVEYKKLLIEKELLKKNIKKDLSEYRRLVKYPSEIEKIARELYFFKKNNEDVFIIEQKNKDNE